MPSLASLLSLAVLLTSPGPEPAPRDRTGVEFRASMGDDAFAGQLAHGRAYQTDLRLRAMFTLDRARQRRIFARSRMPYPTLRFGVTGGVSANTPSDTATDEIDRDDRPYTGFTYAGVIVEVSDGVRNRLWAELDYAAIGPQSGADDFHVAWNRASTGGSARGWQHQTRNELHFDLSADWDHALFEVFPVRGAHLVDVQTHGRLELAELAVAGSAGATIRMGLLRRPFMGVPDRDADALRARAVGWGRTQVLSMQYFVFARADASLVGRRTTVDGSLFDRSDDPNRSPHRARSRRFVPSGEIGVVVQPMRHLDLRFSIHHVGREVDSPESQPHTYGRVSVAGRF